MKNHRFKLFGWIVGGALVSLLLVSSVRAVSASTQADGTYFQVRGMTCKGCVRMVKKRLEEVGLTAQVEEVYFEAKGEEKKHPGGFVRFSSEAHPQVASLCTLGSKLSESGFELLNESGGKLQCPTTQKQ